MSRSPRGLGQVLLACVRQADDPATGHGAAAVPARDLTGLLTAARRHRVAPAVHRAVRSGSPLGLALAAGLDAGTTSALHDDWLAGAGRHLVALRDLAAASDALTARGVGFAVFKGPVLSALLYPRPDLRPYVDLDLLVTPQDLGTAVEALEGAGFELLDRNWPLIRELMLGELHLAAPGGTLIDLHWQLLNRPDARSPFALAPGPLLERAVPEQLGRRTVPGLDPVDRLLHLCLHATASGGDRIGWVWDVARGGGVELDWDEVVVRARSTRTHVPVATMLLRAQWLLGLDVPPSALRGLVPRSWSGAVRVAQALDPLERTAGGTSLTEALGRASLGSPGESFRELVGRQRAGLRRAARGSAHLDRPSRSVFTQAGDAQDRRRFFEAVSRT